MSAAVWDDRAPPAFPPLRGREQADACVLGLGGSGLAAIDELLSAGASVVGIDAGPVAGGAAGRNGGLLRAGVARFHHEARRAHGAQRAARLYAATAAERERLLSRFPALVRRCGYARLAASPDETGDVRAHFEALRADGVRVTWYDGPAGTGFQADDDAATNPAERCRAEAADVSARGARLHEHSAAVRVNRSLVETTNGAVACRVVIVAVDGAIASVLPELTGRIVPVRLQMLAAGLPADHPLPEAGSSRWGWDYWQRLPGGRIAFGGCRDAGGEDERTTDDSVSEPVQQALERRFAEVTGVAPRVTHRWAAIVGYTADGLPVAEQVRPGIWAAGGYSGTGNLLGAVCGRAVARMATGVTTESPLA